MPATLDFQLLFQSSPGSYLVLTPGLKIVAVSDAYLRATLTRRDEIVGRQLFDVFPDNPDDPGADGERNLRASLDRVLQHKIADTMPIQKYDIRKPESEGGGFEERHWRPRNSPVIGPGNRVLYIIHSVADVTELVLLRRWGIEREKVSSDLHGEERFRTAFNVNPEPISIATIDEGRYVDVNESFLRVTGYRREELIGRTSLAMNFWEKPEDRAALLEVLRNQGSVRNFPITFRTRTGEQRSALDSSEIIEVAGEKYLMSIFKDTTDQRILEKQLLQAQKMEAIGQLSGGIAHDFSNLLSVIIGYTEALEEELRSETSRRKCEQITRAGQKAASLVRQLLAFSRQQVLQPTIINLNDVVLELEKMFRRVIGEDVEFCTSLCPDVGQIKADLNQIEQVIMNLIVNSRDAMPQGGRLTIETANVEVDEQYARLHHTHEPGSYVVLSVADTGIGMDAATQARIFDPFFTTKEVGKGTGLGLSTVYGVVKQSGGHIWVYSEPGRGTTFKIYFPCVFASGPVEKTPVAESRSLSGVQTVLLVEDEQALRDLTRNLLVNHGYTVLVASAGAQAIEMVRAYDSPIDLLLTDVVMPGMNGPALAAALSSMKPAMKVVYMSGYSGFAHVGFLDPDAVLLSKPLTREKLLRTVRDVLESPVPAR